VEIIYASGLHAFGFGFGCAQTTLMCHQCNGFGAKNFARRHASRDGVEYQRAACITDPLGNTRMGLAQSITLSPSKMRCRGWLEGARTS
jgi:hypothetical protein